ncbi:hypothetical protein RCL1_002030 [Eukaryota sp. TZLM3-RCL]
MPFAPSRNKIFNGVSDVIGGTPLVDLQNLSKHLELSGTICAKLEFLNPGLSVKDRIAKNMIEAALESGVLTKDSVIIEATSGNTGIGLAMVAASMQIKCILCMPESMSVERRRLLKHLGAELVLTPASLGMRGAIAKANELSQANPLAWQPQQFDNPKNVEAHINSTAVELINDLGSEMDNVYAMVMGVGTGGSITGIATALKAKYPHIRFCAVEPKESPVLSGGNPGPHKIQGIGAGFIPSIVNRELIDSVVQVSADEAFEYARLAARVEGLLCGISSGAALKAASIVASSAEARGKRVITILPSAAERYQSTALFPQE